jgi:microcystin-dependent protein
MPASFPIAFDVPLNPTLNTSMAASGYEHDLAHVNLNDIMKAVEVRVGLNASPDPTSLTNQVNGNIGSITILQGSVSTLTSQLGITNSNLTALTNTVNTNAANITNLTASKLNLAGGTMTGQLIVQYRPPAVSVNSYVTSQLFLSNLGSADNPPQLGFQATGLLGLSLYLNASGLNAITNLGGSSLIINSQGQLNPLSIADGSLPSAKIIPATVNTAQLANNSVTKPILAAGSIDASKFDSTVMGAIQVAVGCPTGTILPFSAITTPSGWLPCDGRAVSRTTYSALYALVGTAYGTGDGSSTFNLPDLRSRVPLGAYYNGTAWTAPPGLTAWAWGATGGAETHTLTTGEMPAHNHTDSGHQHYCSGVNHLHVVPGVDHTHGIPAGQFNHSHTVPCGTVAGYATGSSGGLWAAYLANTSAVTLPAGNTGAADRSLNTTSNAADRSLAFNSNNASAVITNTGGGAAHSIMPPFQVIAMYIIKY